MKNVFTIDVDIKLKMLIDEPTVVQNDNIRFIINVFDGGQPLSLGSATTVSLASTRLDHVTVVRTGTKTGTNTVQFDLGKEETKVPGRVEATAQFYDSEGRVSTISFSYRVVKDPTGVGYVPIKHEQTLIETVLNDGPLVIQQAQDAANYAKAQGDYAKQVGDENKTRWLTAVNTYADIATTYPKPQLGDAVQTIDDSKIYRWDGTQWVWTQQYNANAITDVQNKIGILIKKTDDIISIKEFGAKGDGVTDDTQAFLNAFDALNGTSPKFLLLPAGTYLLNFDGDINIPINVKIISLTRATIKLGQPNTRLTYISPGTSSGGYVQYWSYMHAGFINITVTGTGTKTVKTLLLISKIIGAKFENCAFSNAITGVHIQNRDGLWTEMTEFVKCGFENCTYNIHLDGNLHTVEPGTTAGVSDGSFAYTTFKNCAFTIGGNAGEEVCLYVSNGGTLYGGSIELRGWLKNSDCKIIKTDRGSITYMDFNVVAESFGNAAHFLHLTGGHFWYNTGNARFPSPQIKMYQDEKTPPDIVGNAITVMGTELQRDDGAPLFLGDQIPSIMVDHVLKRHIIRREIIHFSKFGSASGYIGLMPAKLNGERTKYRIIKAEIGCKTPGRGNTGGKWYFDFRKGFEAASWMYAGTTNFYIPDGYEYIVLHMDYKFPDGYYYDAPTVFASAPTTVGSKNDGTPPEDVFIALHYVLDRH